MANKQDVDIRQYWEAGASIEDCARTSMVSAGHVEASLEVTAELDTCDHCNQPIVSHIAVDHSVYCSQKCADDAKAVVRCDQCAAATINGVFCHEHGCPNQKKTWLPDRGWVAFVKCFECGCDVEKGERCDCQDEDPEADEAEPIEDEDAIDYGRHNDT